MFNNEAAVTFIRPVLNGTSSGNKILTRGQWQTASTDNSFKEFCYKGEEK
jgi:hypothetical protein